MGLGASALTECTWVCGVVRGSAAHALGAEGGEGRPEQHVRLDVHAARQLAVHPLALLARQHRRALLCWLAVGSHNPHLLIRCGIDPHAGLGGAPLPLVRGNDMARK